MATKKSVVGDIYKEQPNFEKYSVVPKIRQSLILMTDIFNDRVREMIIMAYSSQYLYKKWKEKRKKYDDMMLTSGKMAFGKARRRQILEFPNVYIYDFCDRIMGSIYGPEWKSNKRALKHELVRPWLVVDEKYL